MNKKRSLKTKYNKKKAFSLVEALISIVIISIITIIAAPVLTGKSQRSFTKFCVNGGSVSYNSNDNTTITNFSIPEGVRHISIAAVGKGGNGSTSTDNSTGDNSGYSAAADFGSSGGTASNAVYLGNFDIEKNKAKTVKVNFTGNKIEILDENGVSITQKKTPLTPEIPIVIANGSAGSSAYSQKSARVNTNYEPRLGSFFKAGSATFSDFPLALAGKGGSGSYRFFSNGNTGGFAMVTIEWATNCFDKPDK